MSQSRKQCLPLEFLVQTLHREVKAELSSLIVLKLNGDGLSHNIDVTKSSLFEVSGVTIIKRYKIITILFATEYKILFYIKMNFMF